MKTPLSPPPFDELWREAHADPAKLAELFRLSPGEGLDADYLHWDKLRHKPPPSGVSHRQWWLALKLQRRRKAIPLRDRLGGGFSYSTTELAQEQLHQIDLASAGSVGVPEPVVSPQARDRYLVRSLVEEAITSSQLEGAATTREEAKRMLRTGRPPRDQSEQMILNNYRTMERIRELKDAELTPELVLEIHALVARDTLSSPDAVGRLRRSDEDVVVGDEFGEVFHRPPAAEELSERLEQMCAFANATAPFVHPVVRAILLHFWLAYDHPFVDGNGRTARALFYWAMSHRGYWLFEFISISTILRKRPAAYGRSFLYVETDDNDLTYFLHDQLEVIRKGIRELQHYVERKSAESRELESRLRALEQFNHRQVELLRHAIKHPGYRYTINSHRSSHGVVYQTARTDLLSLEACGLLRKAKQGRALRFIAPPDLVPRLQAMDLAGS